MRILLEKTSISTAVLFFFGIFAAACLCAFLTPEAMAKSPAPIVQIGDIAPNTVAIGQADEITVTGENFQSVKEVFVGDAACDNLSVVSDTELTCDMPTSLTEAGTYSLEVTATDGKTYEPRGLNDLTAPKAFIYAGEIWGFSMDTTISTDVTFYATSPADLEVDFGDGTWTTFLSGATITGTAIPTTGQGDLAQIRIRPIDPTAENWFPSLMYNYTIYWASLLTNKTSMDAIITIDYPLTTLSVSTVSGAELAVQEKTGVIFNGASSLERPFFFINTPGYTVTSIPDSFLAQTHVHNPSLTDTVDLYALADWEITSVGTSFLDGLHECNDSLTQPVDLSPLANWEVESIGDLFLAFIHSKNYSLVNAVDLSPLANWNVSGSSGIAFMSTAHYNNSSLVTPLDLAPLASWSITSIGQEFMINLHADNVLLEDAIDFSALASWPVTDIGDRFLSNAHSGNIALTTPVNLSGLSSWNVSTIDLYFLYETHRDNIALATPIDLSPLADWDVDVAGFWGAFAIRVHYNNTSLLDISDFRLPDWMMGLFEYGILHEAFYLESPTITVGGEPTLMNGSLISSHHAPDYNIGTYTNRSSITPVNPNWKL